MSFPLFGPLSSGMNLPRQRSPQVSHVAVPAPKVEQALHCKDGIAASVVYTELGITSVPDKYPDLIG